MERSKNSERPLRQKPESTVAPFLRLGSVFYKWIRKKTCPFGIISDYIRDIKGNIYDFGCGYGTFIDFLAADSMDNRRFYGFDNDKRRINLASSGKTKQNISFKEVDISSDLRLSGAQCIILIDVLYLLPFTEQRKLVERCFSYLCDGGLLVAKEIDKHPKWKYLFTRAQEILVFAVLRRQPRKKFYFQSSRYYLELFENAGFSVKIDNIHKGYPYSHVLYICRKEKR